MKGDTFKEVQKVALIKRGQILPLKMENKLMSFTAYSLGI